MAVIEIENWLQLISSESMCAASVWMQVWCQAQNKTFSNIKNLEYHTQLKMYMVMLRETICGTFVLCLKTLPVHGMNSLDARLFFSVSSETSSLPYLKRMTPNNMQQVPRRRYKNGNSETQSNRHHTLIQYRYQQHMQNQNNY